MSILADPYYLYLDDPQTVTLSATRADKESTDVIIYASRLSVKKTRDLFGSIALEGESCGWNIPNILLSNITTLKPGDKLTHGSDVWRIKEANRNALRTQWNLLTVLER